MVVIVLGVLAENVETGDEIKSCSHSSLRTTGEVTECESFVFTCLTYRNVQRFRNGAVHEFYGLKASQMSNVHASSHDYPHVQKSRIFGNRISKVRWPTTVTAKELTSWQKEKPHGEKNNLMAERITTISQQKK